MFEIKKMLRFNSLLKFPELTWVLQSSDRSFVRQCEAFENIFVSNKMTEEVSLLV